MNRIAKLCATALTLGVAVTGCNEYYYNDLGYDTVFEGGGEYTPYNTRTNDMVVEHLRQERAARQVEQTETVANAVRGVVPTTLDLGGPAAPVEVTRAPARTNSAHVAPVSIPKEIRIVGTKDYAKCVFDVGVTGSVSINDGNVLGNRVQSIVKTGNISAAQANRAQSCMKAKLNATLASKGLDQRPL